MSGEDKWDGPEGLEWEPDTSQLCEMIERIADRLGVTSRCWDKDGYMRGPFYYEDATGKEVEVGAEAAILEAIDRLTARVAELEQCQPIALSEPTDEERFVRREDFKKRRNFRMGYD